MSMLQVNCGFIPLVDSAPLVIAREMGFASDEGIDLQLHREPTWSSLRDKLVFGQFDAAHMLSPVPVATSMGLGGVSKRLDVLSVLSVNGNVIGVSPKLHQAMRAVGPAGDFKSAEAIGRCLIAAQPEPLRIGVPFPFSMHVELVYHWLGSLGMKVPSSLDVRTVPPPLMSEAIAAGEIDAFCVGEPWGSVIADNAGGVLILPGQAIWAFAPEKVLAVGHDWTESHKEAAHGLLRSVWKAANWLSKPDNRIAACEILARPHYVNVSSDLIEAAMTGNIGIGINGISHKTDRFVEFFDAAATFPWKSQGAWIASRLSARMGGDRAVAMDIGKAAFRSDIYREALEPMEVDLPGASQKLEGALAEPTPVSSTMGRMILGPDCFFDGQIFDPGSS